MNTRPESNAHLKVIDRCLDNRLPILQSIESIQQESRHLRRHRGLIQLKKSLNGDLQAVRLITDPDLAAFLPFVLSFDPEKETIDDYREWIRNFIRCEDRKRWTRILFSYPVMLGLLYVAIVFIACTLIVPQFGAMYKEFELRVPDSTARLLWLSEQITEHSLQTLLVTLVVGGCLAGICYFIWLAIQNAQELRFMRYLTRSSKAQLDAMSKLTLALSEMLRIGASLPEAFQAAGLATGQLFYRVETERVAQALEAEPPAPGQAYRVLSQSFPETLDFALRAGPGGQPSVPVIRQLSRIYLDRMEQRINYTNAFAFPIATILIALLIRQIAVDLMLPLISLITSLSH